MIRSEAIRHYRRGRQYDLVVPLHGFYHLRRKPARMKVFLLFVIGFAAIGFGGHALGIPLWFMLYSLALVGATFIVLTLAIGASTFRGF